MKKILFILLLLFAVNVYADETTIYKEITKIEDINEIKDSPNIKEIYIKNMQIDDISFINHLNNLQKISIFYSKVDLSKINNKNIKEMYIISSYIVNDNFLSLANSPLKKLDLDGSYVTSIYSLKDVISLEELYLSSISNLRSLEPIINLPNLKKLDFVGSEELVNEKVLNYMKEKHITGTNYDESKYIYLNDGLNERLDKILEELELDDLDEIEKIRKITIYVTDLIKYDDDCGVKNKCKKEEFDFNILLKSLTGNGICYNYAILTNKLLNKAGIKSYLVSGYNRTNLAHEWLNIYYNDKWYGLDPTWIDTFSNVLNTLKKTKKSRFFMSDLETNLDFNKLHKEDVMPSKIVNPNAVIIDKIEESKLIEEIENTDNDYYILFIVSIIIVIIFSLIFIIKILKYNR